MPQEPNDPFLEEMAKMNGPLPVYHPVRPSAPPPVAAPPADTLCWHCKKRIDAQDNYCRHCGYGQGSHVKWYYKHWGIVVSTFMIGPFSLIFAWRSPLLSRTAKLVYLVVIGGGSVWLAFEMYNAVMAGLSYLTGGGALGQALNGSI
jgi:hypothetical protein